MNENWLSELQVFWQTLIKQIQKQNKTASTDVSIVGDSERATIDDGTPTSKPNSVETEREQKFHPDVHFTFPRPLENNLHNADRAHNMQ